MMTRVGCLLAMLMWTLTSCTTAQLRLPRPESPHAGHSRCERLFIEVESAVINAGVQDVQAQRIAGFPHLRVSRFLASFRDELDGAEQLASWIGRLRQLDQEGRGVEIANLPEAEHLAASAGHDSADGLLRDLEDCGETLVADDLGDRQRIQTLIDRAAVPDSYSDVARIVGIYPVTRWFVSQGIGALQDRIREGFRSPAPPLTTALIEYRPVVASTMSQSDVATLLAAAAARDPLSIPDLSVDEQQRIFDRFAPVWRVDSRAPTDRVGTPVWTGQKTPGVDITAPVVFRKMSFTRIDDAVLPQLNYIIWFPGRPLTGPLDLLGGNIDGITFRITLGRDGLPLMLDAMHNCGCYHMYFPPESGLQASRAAREAPEPLLIPAAVEQRPGRFVLDIESGTHYIRGVSRTDQRMGISLGYTQLPYDRLRSLPAGGEARRSLFGSRGLITGTTRRERWLLWPMGVLEPGAMRQWGHHATAFVGRRHFDDPRLLDTYFERNSP